MTRKTQVECDLCGEIMENNTDDEVAVNITMDILLRSIDPLVFGDIYEAGEYSPLMSGSSADFDCCFDCLRDVVDFSLIRKKYESNE